VKKFGLITLLGTALFFSFYALREKPSFKPLRGYHCLRGEVISKNFNRVWFISDNHPYYFYTKRKLFPSDGIEVCGTFRGIRLSKVDRLKVDRNLLQRLRVEIHETLKWRALKSARTKVEKKLISALLFGENWFSRGERKKLSHLGIYHLIVISGMHYALLFTFFLIFPVRWKFRYWVALLFFTFFTFLLLFPKAPAYRAFFSFALFLLAKLLEQNYSSLKALLLAYSPSLWLFPHWFTNIGFWLSYLASGSLILYYGSKKVPEESFFKNFFGKFLGLEATLVVSTAIFPLLVVYLHFFSLGSFLYAFPFTLVVEAFLITEILNMFTFWSFPPLLELQHKLADLFGFLFYNLPPVGVIEVSSFPQWSVFLLPALFLFGLMMIKEKRFPFAVLFFFAELLLLFLFHYGYHL